MPDESQAFPDAVIIVHGNDCTFNVVRQVSGRVVATFGSLNEARGYCWLLSILQRAMNLGIGIDFDALDRMAREDDHLEYVEDDHGTVVPRR